MQYEIFPGATKNIEWKQQKLLCSNYSFRIGLFVYRLYKLNITDSEKNSCSLLKLGEIEIDERYWKSRELTTGDVTAIHFHSLFQKY
jgi:hypothetical protein